MNKQRLIEERVLAQHRIIADRLSADPDAIIGIATENLRRWSLKYDQDERPRWIDEWCELLTHAPTAIAQVLSSESEEARRLRSSSPFAGVLTARERWALYREIKDET